MFKRLGTVIFGVIFLLMVPTSRQLVEKCLTEVREGITAWAPAAYVLLAAPLVVALVVMTWPGRR
jgi:hypothetical protein